VHSPKLRIIKNVERNCEIVNGYAAKASDFVWQANDTQQAEVCSNNSCVSLNITGVCYYYKEQNSTE
jgi:hypothetical protein